jgi:hypothetical protein
MRTWEVQTGGLTGDKKKEKDKKTHHNPIQATGQLSGELVDGKDHREPDVGHVLEPADHVPGAGEVLEERLEDPVPPPSLPSLDPPPSPSLLPPPSSSMSWSLLITLPTLARS